VYNKSVAKASLCRICTGCEEFAQAGTLVPPIWISYATEGLRPLQESELQEVLPQDGADT